MTKYRKKPVVIEAIEWTGTNIDNIFEFVSDPNIVESWSSDSDECIICTLEGEMKATKGYFIIKGVNGEFYPCKPDIFWKTYESV